MNFIFMPELKWTYGYFWVLGLMVLIAVGELWWFYKKGWFD
jgi:magnesium transporter